jgi:hypothetical protein
MVRNHGEKIMVRKAHEVAHCEASDFILDLLLLACSTVTTKVTTPLLQKEKQR